MGKVFGEPVDGLDYQERVGCYAVIVRDGKVAAVKSKGAIFLPGGGLESNETMEECLNREMLEETGYELKVERFIGKASRYFLLSKEEPILGIGYFYLASLGERVQEPTDIDHQLVWVDFTEIDRVFFHSHQVWAIKQVLEDGEVS